LKFYHIEDKTSEEEAHSSKLTGMGMASYFLMSDGVVKDNGTIFSKH
jgi:hypothetical protein